MSTTYRNNTRTRTNPKNHIAARCPAERIATRKADPAAAPATWHVHVGFSKLSITGPLDHQWFAASKAYMRGTVGSDAERALADRTVAILNREHNGDETIDRPKLDVIIARAAAELKASA